MYIIGIDPGNSGAIAVIDENGKYVDSKSFDILVRGKKTKRINGVDVVKFLTPYQGKTHRVYIENVGARPGQGVSSTFTFGHSAGMLEGVCAAMMFPYVLVTPVEWKKAFKLTSFDKEVARLVAQKLFPEAPLGRKKDINLADALLIAYHVNFHLNPYKPSGNNIPLQVVDEQGFL
jgi:crossover junction endodeoxyribonuclease RuvC